jgi:hypothetical protein
MAVIEKLTEKQKRSKAGKASRRKGQEWEQALVRMFRKAMPGAQVRRHPQSSGADEPDVTADRLDIEGKVGKNPPIRGALDQLPPRPGHWRAVCTKEDRRPPIAHIPLDDFLDLISEWWERRPEK